MSTSYDALVSAPSSSSLHMHHYTNSKGRNAQMMDHTNSAHNDDMRTYTSLRNAGGAAAGGDTEISRGEGSHSSETTESMSALASNTSQILVGSIVQRLVKRLPSNSGERLSSLEQEELVRSSVANLVNHSEYQLAVVVRELLLVLESLNKQLSQPNTDDSIQVKVMQSQLFILQVLVACLIHYWRQSLRERKYEGGKSEDQSDFLREWADPPPLDDSLAKQILSIMIFYLRLTVAREDLVYAAAIDTQSKVDGGSSKAAVADKSKAARWDADDRESDGITDSTPLAAFSVINGLGLFVLHPSFPPSRSPFDLDSDGNNKDETLPKFNTAATQGATSSSTDASKDTDRGNTSLLLQSIYRQASQVIFFLSSSNWSIIFARIKLKLSQLSTTPDDFPNTSELHLLECSNFVRTRLGSVIQELSSSFLHLKRNAQYAIALIIRRSILAWIQYHPSEYAQLLASNRRLEGGPDILFDHAYTLAEGARKKNTFWPMMTSLLLLCPDIMSKLAIDDGRKSGSLKKKSAFLELLHKGLRASKLGDISALCCIDICNAATVSIKGDSGLRLLVPDLESDLREKLFESKEPMNSATVNIIKIPLMVATFAASFRMDHDKTLREVMPILLVDTDTIISQIVLVKSCISLASERKNLPWDPDMDLLYTPLSAKLRATFKDLVYRLSPAGSFTNKKEAISTKMKPLDEDTSSRVDLLQAILQLWHIDLKAVAYGLSLDLSESFLLSQTALGADERSISQQAITEDSLFSLLHMLSRVATSSPSWQVHNKAIELLFSCLQLCEQGSKDFRHKARETVLHASSHLAQQVANLLSASTSINEQQHWLTLLMASLKQRSDLLDIMEAEREQTRISNQTETNQERQSVKIAMLLTICSANAEICSLALQTCREAGRFRRKLQIPSFQQTDYMEWTRLYERLGEVDSIQTGRIAQQKRVRACLREVTTCTAPLFAAWKEAFRRWQDLTLAVAKPMQDESSEVASDKAAQWHNFAGCLAAIGGACIVERSPVFELPSRKQSESVWSEESIQESPLQHVENFVHAMVDLLVSDSIWVREKAKETLGADMNPRLNGILFFMIHSVLSDFFDKATGQPKPTDMFTIFVEQAIAVMQMVLQRITTDSVTEITSHVDIGAVMVLFAEYLNALNTRDQAARIRASMCQLCEQLMEKKHYFTFNNELRVRNRLFQVLAGWTSESIEGIASTDKSDRLQRDLDVICLRTISILLDKLPLLLSEDVPVLDDSVDLAKSRQFSTCFNYFIKVLNRAKILEETVNPNERLMPPSASGLSLGRLKESQTLRDVVPLKQSAVLALSNLLASNIGTGLHHALPLAYQDDLQLRTALMQIMTNVLNQGAAFEDLERLNASEKQSKLIDLIGEPDLQLALSICNVCRGYDVDAIDYILLNIFDSRGGIIKFLKAALDEEIEATTSEEMVFRSNLFRIHLLSLFGRTHGYDYLRSILAPLVAEMANKPKGYSFEIDPQRLESGESAIVNQHRLEEMAQLFIDQICNSAHRIPAVLREICRHIRLLMDRKFPSSRYQGVGGYIFLRFINPAVVAPQTIDINITGPAKELRRGLLLISKILQTLASNTLFPQHKEPYMTSLNELLKRNVWKVTTFLDHVSDSRANAERLSAADQPIGLGIHPFGYGIDNEDQATLHRFFYDNIDKIGKELLSRSSSIADNNGSIKSSSTVSTRHRPGEGLYHSMDGKKVYENLCTVLAEMGDPSRSDEQFSTNSDSTNRQALQEFLRRHNGRNIDNAMYQQIFRKGPASKSGRPVFYFTKWAQNAQTLDYEGFICHVLQVLRPGMTQPYDIVFDLTSAQPNNLTPPQWLSYFVDLLPIEYASNVRNVFFFNTNTSIRLQTRPWLGDVERSNSNTPPPSKNPVLQQLQVNANVIYCTGVGDLEAYIERRNIALDSQTMSLYSSPEEARFSQVTMVWYYRALLPVVFKLSENHLQITSLKPQAIMQGSSGYINEVFHLADIDDVRAISVRGDDTTFYVTCRGGSMSFLFISRDRAEIVSSLRQAKARVSRFESNTTTRSMDRSLLPSDVPGTLLNMSMLNITSQDSQLRLSAYDLLCALSTSFSFGASNARNRLLSTKGLALSANTSSFVADLSRDFAQAASGVTLEFLSSFFEGFERATLDQKSACLQYMTPWLPNLLHFVHAPREEQREYQKKIKEILSNLISMTIQHPDLYSTIQRSVWSQFAGRMDELIPTLLDVFCEAAMDSGLHTERFNAVLDTMISFASINLRGKLLAKLRRVIAKTAQNPTVSQLPDNLAWKEIATLIRMNMALSFTSGLESTLYLPELLHIILLLSGNGVDATRHAIYASAINLVHSLATGERPHEEGSSNISINKQANGSAKMNSVRDQMDAAADGTNQTSLEGVEKLRELLTTLSSPETLPLFGLSSNANFAPVSAYDAGPMFVRESPNDCQVARLAMMMYQIVDIAAPTLDTCNAWRARLTSLVTSTAFQYNPLIQSRAFILLGCLAEVTGSMLQSQGQDEDEAMTLFEVDDDLLYQILVSLRGSIQEWATSGNDAPIISIVTCLSKVVPILPDKSRYLPQMFWLGVCIVQYGHIPLFKSGINLINSTIASISQRRLAEKSGSDLISYLMMGRFLFREDAIRLDDETGVDFETNFSFALAALVVKGLRHPLTRDSTINLLRSMLENTALDAQSHARSRNGQVSTVQLGFFVSLLPGASKREDYVELLLLAGIDEEYVTPKSSSNGTLASPIRSSSEDQGLYTHLETLENKEALLVITLLASLLQHSTVSDSEKQQLYRLLADSSRQFPAIVSILYENILPNIKEVYLNCQNDDILRSVDVITKVAISESIFQVQFQETKKRGGAEAYLIESGFACLLDCGTFTKLKDSRRMALAKLSTELLTGLIDAGTA